MPTAIERRCDDGFSFGILPRRTFHVPGDQKLWVRKTHPEDIFRDDVKAVSFLLKKRRDIVKRFEL